MLIISFLLSVIFWFAQPARCAEQALAINQGITNYDNSIAIGANSYMDLVRNSKVFVDNTLLLRELKTKSGADSISYLFLGPDKWGKSMNLDMIKTFYEIPTDENGKKISLTSSSSYKLFVNGEITFDDGHTKKLLKPLLIANDAEISNLGKYNVTFITFKDCVSENATVVKQKMQLALEKALGSFDWANSRSRLNNWMTTSYPLRAKRILLIEDYDTPILNFLQKEHPPSEDMYEIIRLMKNFLTYAFAKTEGKMQPRVSGPFYLAVATGKYNLEHHDPMDYDYWYGCRDLPIYDHFGFTNHSVKQLLKMRRVDEKLSRQALKWYGGIKSETGNEMFNPTSIAKFLQQRKLDCYGKNDENEELIQNAIDKHPQLVKSLLSLISKKEIPVYSKLPLRFKYKLELEDVLHDGKVTTPARPYDEKAFFTYLYEEGYLTKKWNSLSARLPNNEMAFVLANDTIMYLKKTNKISAKLKTAAAALLHLTASNETSTATKSLRESLRALYYKSESRLKEDSIRSILNCVVLQMQCLSKFEIDVYYDKALGPDFVMVNDETGRVIVVEFVYDSDSSTTEAIELAANWTSVFENFTTVRTKQLIGITISPDKATSVATKFINS